MHRLKSCLLSMAEKIREMISGGIIWIFGGSIVSQICGMISSMVVIQFLPKNDYGCFVSANNFYSYFAVFIGLGLDVAILQFCSERRSEENKKAIYRYSFLAGELFNILLGVLIMGFAVVRARRDGADSVRYLAYMSGLPLVTYVKTYLQTFLRIKRLNKQYGVANIAYSIAIVVSKIVLTRYYGAAGLIYSIYVASAVSIVLCLLFCRQEKISEILFQKGTVLSGPEKKEILSYSAICSITNFASSVLLLLDITCLNFVLRNNVVLADYNVASVFPSACDFIPGCLILYFYPIIVEKFQDSVDEFRAFFGKMVGIFSVVAGSISIGLFVFAPLILRIFYGEQYVSCSAIMRILCINFLISASFRILFGNVIAAIKQVKVNLIHNVIAGVLNVVLDLILIQNMGSMGAALATTFVTIFISLLEIVFILKFLQKEKHRRG